LPPIEAVSRRRPVQSAARWLSPPGGPSPGRASPVRPPTFPLTGLPSPQSSRPNPPAGISSSGDSPFGKRRTSSQKRTCFRTASVDNRNPPARSAAARICPISATGAQALAQSISCFYSKSANLKSVTNVSRIGIMATPWGCLGTSRGRPADTVTAQGVANPADLLLEGRGHRRWPSAAVQDRRPRFAAEPPQSPVFCGAKNAPK
jgi:hypothetical protein